MTAGTPYKRGDLSDATVKELEALQGKLHIAYCTATAIQLALRNGLEDADVEVGQCMGHHVLDELCQIGEAFDLILLRLGGKPRFMPLTDPAS